MEKYSLTVGGSVRRVNRAELPTLDIEALPGDSFHLLHEGAGYRCRIVRIDTQAKLVYVAINGRELLVEVADSYDLVVKQLGFVTAEVNTSKDLYAPMPGLVLDVMVEEGQSIVEGTPLMILEAMKMENLLKADGDGVVKSVQVLKGAAVDKRQLLIEIE